MPSLRPPSAGSSQTGANPLGPSIGAVSWWSLAKPASSASLPTPAGCRASGRSLSTSALSPPWAGSSQTGANLPGPSVGVASWRSMAKPTPSASLPTPAGCRASGRSLSVLLLSPPSAGSSQTGACHPGPGVGVDTWRSMAKPTSSGGLPTPAGCRASGRSLSVLTLSPPLGRQLTSWGKPSGPRRQSRHLAVHSQAYFLSQSPHPSRVPSGGSVSQRVTAEPPHRPAAHRLG